MNSDEKIKKIKEEMEAQRVKILKDIINDVPLQQILSVPGLAMQMIVALRGVMASLKMLDENYEFKLEDIPGYVNGRPAYIG